MVIFHAAPWRRGHRGQICDFEVKIQLIAMVAMAMVIVVTKKCLFYFKARCLCFIHCPEIHDPEDHIRYLPKDDMGSLWYSAQSLSSLIALVLAFGGLQNEPMWMVFDPTIFSWYQQSCYQQTSVCHVVFRCDNVIDIFNRS